MTSYRRQVHHHLSVERAKRQVRRHAWETEGYGRGYVAETVKGLFLDFSARLHAMNLPELRDES